MFRSLIAVLMYRRISVCSMCFRTYCTPCVCLCIYGVSVDPIVPENPRVNHRAVSNTGETINICLGKLLRGTPDPKQKEAFLWVGTKGKKTNTDMLCFAYYMYSYLCTIALNVIYSSCRARSFRHTITTTPSSTQHSRV